jgi:GTP1/Obg family GTP-binding protein
MSKYTVVSIEKFASLAVEIVGKAESLSRKDVVAVISESGCRTKSNPFGGEFKVGRGVYTYVSVVESKKSKKSKKVVMEEPTTEVLDAIEEPVIDFLVDIEEMSDILTKISVTNLMNGRIATTTCGPMDKTSPMVEGLKKRLSV